MKLWILKARSGLDKDDNPWENPYDKNHGFVVRATSVTHAREIANAAGGDENRPPHGDVWLDPKYSTCEALTHGGECGIILEDYING